MCQLIYHMEAPNPNIKYPIENNKELGFLKNFITNPKIEVGDYSYYHDFENVENFEKNNVKYLFDFNDDKLIIGKFCMIAADVTFIMNGSNHLTDSISTYPFSVFGKSWAKAMDGKAFPQKGNIEVGNDVWIGYGVTIMPGVKIGDGAIVATKSVVIKDVAPYAIVGGNPAKEIKKRYSDEEIVSLLKVAWWDWPEEKLSEHIQHLTNNNVEALLKL